MSPVIFRIVSDEFAVIAPYIPPQEKVLGVAESMKEIGVDIDYLQMSYPSTFSSYGEALDRIFSFTKRKLIGLYNIIP